MIVDKVVLITGCSSGIGLSLSKAFFEYGFKTYASSRNLESIKDLEAMGINTIQLDVKDKESIDKAVNYIIEKENKIDILINNSGVCTYGPCIELPDDQLEDMFQTNFFGVVKTVKSVVPHMIKERKGLIINMGSVAGFLPMPYSSGYCSSKSAMHSWSDSLRVELSPFNIKVLTVQPGPFKTEIVDKAMPKLKELLDSNPNSPYAPIFEDIFTRPLTSKANQASVQSLTNSLMKKIFSKNNTGHYRIGPGSIGLLILSWLPTRLIDFIFSRKFGLYKLKLIIQKNDLKQQNNKEN